MDNQPSYGVAVSAERKVNDLPNAGMKEALPQTNVASHNGAAAASAPKLPHKTAPSIAAKSVAVVDGGGSCASVVESNSRVLDEFMESNPDAKVKVLKRGRAAKDKAKKLVDDEESDSPSEESFSEDDDEEKPQKMKKLLPAIQRVSQIGTLSVRNGQVRNVDIEPMIESTDVWRAGDNVELYRRLKTDGYILLRGVVPREKARAAYKVVDEFLRRKGTVRADGSVSANQKGMTVETTTGDVISGADLYVDPEGDAVSEAEGWRNVGQHPIMQDALIGAETRGVLRALAQGATQAQSLPVERSYRPAVLQPYTWLRIKSKREMTPEHADYFHFKRMTPLFNSASENKLLEEEIAAARVLLEAEKNGVAPPVAPVAGVEGAGVNGEGGAPVAAAAVAAPVVEEEGDEECEVCHSQADGDKMLLCEECDKGYHMYCLQPPLEAIPEGEWYCAECHPRPVFGTAWIPLHDLTLRNGLLTMLRGSQYLPDYDESIGIKQLPKSFRTHLQDAPWHLTEKMNAGDMVLFDIRTIHSTTVNLFNNFRISADLRWCLKPSRANYGVTAPSKAVLAVQQEV